jgi:hypothetical protein
MRLKRYKENRLNPRRKLEFQESLNTDLYLPARKKNPDQAHKDYF